MPDRIKTLIAHTQSIVDDMDIIDVNRFSNFEKMMRVTSRVLNVNKNKSLGAISASPSVDDLLTAESWWKCRLLYIQIGKTIIVG